MAVKVLITRRFREGTAMEVLGLLNQIRAMTVYQPGYISGETLFSRDNPQTILVVSAWESDEYWGMLEKRPHPQGIRGKNRKSAAGTCRH